MFPETVDAIYSLDTVFTGFARAALSETALIVTSAIISVIRSDSINGTTVSQINGDNPKFIR